MSSYFTDVGIGTERVSGPPKGFTPGVHAPTWEGKRKRTDTQTDGPTDYTGRSRKFVECGNREKKGKLGLHDGLVGANFSSFIWKELNPVTPLGRGRGRGQTRSLIGFEYWLLSTWRKGMLGHRAS